MPNAEVYRGQAVVAKVSKALRKAGLGPLLWGEHVLRAVGASLPASHIQFLIEDKDIDRAYAALLAKARKACVEGVNCPEAQTGTPQPSPDAHICFNGTPVNLHKKTKFMALMPCLNIKGFCNHNKFFMGADEPCLPEPTGDKGGRYAPGLDVVMLPTPRKFVEALVWLVSDESVDPDHAGTWKQWLTLMRTDIRTGLINPFRLEPQIMAKWEEATPELGKFNSALAKK